MDASDHGPTHSCKHPGAFGKRLTHIKIRVTKLLLIFSWRWIH